MWSSENEPGPNPDQFVPSNNWVHEVVEITIWCSGSKYRMKKWRYIYNIYLFILYITYLRFYELRFPWAELVQDIPNPILPILQCCQRSKLPSSVFLKQVCSCKNISWILKELINDHILLKT